MKKIRMILPALAILFAVAGAIASNASPALLTIVQVSNAGGLCNVNGTCDTSDINQTCEISAGKQLEEIATSCAAFDGLGKFANP